ncbi:hypothetical protein [Bradyrhizobium icense]|uniref:Uncharacterized protein n=1 Tax=Bradyrhizobium icense TaxID=1274631 RepID=A0A1B1UD53_9BRAD|nr:hypothetical protein [Bradyrhizobium icense]ANW00683.1 hypothetical protein LMTR13_11390 [Bradyrhizobium icense]
MTDKTRTELIQRAAKLLALIEPGEAPATEDYNSLDGLIDPLIEQLAEDQIYYVDDANAIKPAIFEPLARLLANMAGPDFGSPINEEARRRDEQTLRRMGGAKPTGEVMKTEYY